MPDDGSGLPDPEILAGDLVRAAAARGLRLVTAESCTAGLVAALIAAIPGASKALWGGFVTYSNEAKVRVLNLSAGLIARHGAVSAEVAAAMAEGALTASGAAATGADLALAVTGLAGPEGDGSAVPVGDLWLALARKNGKTETRRRHFSLPRNEFRRAAALEALSFFLQGVTDFGAPAVSINN